MLVALFHGVQVYGQVDSVQYIIDFDDVSLHLALKTLQKDYGINYAYDVKSLRSTRIDKTIYGNTPQEISQKLLENTSFSFRDIGGTFVVFQELTEDLNRPPPTQYNVSIAGKVTDRSDSQTLPFTNIVLLYDNQIWAASDSGFFSIDSIPTDTNTLLFSHVGYDSFLLRLDPSMDLGNLKISLNESLGLINSAEILAQRAAVFSVSEIPGVQAIDVQKALRIPNAGQPDIYNAARLIPGVRALGNNQADLEIRGGASSENLTRLDGYTIFNPSHFNGVYSAFHPKSIDQMDIYKSAYSARFGGRSSGLVEAKTRDGLTEKLDVHAGLNPIGADLMLEMPVVANRVGFMVAGRRTFTDFWENGLYKKRFNALYNSNIPGNDLERDAFVEPSDALFFFSDLTAKALWKVSSQDRISISNYQGSDYFRMSYPDPDDECLTMLGDEVNWASSGYGITYNRQWNPRVNTSLSYSQSKFRNRLVSRRFNSDASIYEEQIQQSNISEKALRLIVEGDYKAHQLSGGASSVGYSVTQNVLKESEKFDNENPESSEIALFAEDVWRIHKRLIVSLGFRSTLYGNTLSKDDRGSRLFVEPRAYMTWSPIDELRAKFAWGRHVQTIRQIQDTKTRIDQALVWFPSNGGDIPFIDSKQSTVGLTFEKGFFTADVEAYMKVNDGVNEDWEGIFPSFQDNLDNIQYGQRNIRGMDLLVQQSGKRHSGMVGYTLSKIEQTFGNISAPVPGSADRRHVWKLVYLYKFKGGQFTATYVHGSGTRFTNFIPVGNPIVPEDIFFKRLSPIERLNLGLVYDIDFDKRWSAEINFSVSNVLNRNNSTSRVYAQNDVIVDGKDLGVLPSISINVKF